MICVNQCCLLAVSFEDFDVVKELKKIQDSSSQTKQTNRRKKTWSINNWTAQQKSFPWTSSCSNSKLTGLGRQARRTGFRNPLTYHHRHHRQQCTDWRTITEPPPPKQPAASQSDVRRWESCMPAWDWIQYALPSVHSLSFGTDENGGEDETRLLEQGEQEELDGFQLALASSACECVPFSFFIVFIFFSPKSKITRKTRQNWIHSKAHRWESRWRTSRSFEEEKKIKGKYEKIKAKVQEFFWQIPSGKWKSRNLVFTIKGIAGEKGGKLGFFRWRWRFEGIQWNATCKTKVHRILALKYLELVENL